MRLVRLLWGEQHENRIVIFHPRKSGHLTEAECCRRLGRCYIVAIDSKPQANPHEFVLGLVDGGGEGRKGEVLVLIWRNFDF